MLHYGCFLIKKLLFLSLPPTLLLFPETAGLFDALFFAVRPAGGFQAHWLDFQPAGGVSGRHSASDQWECLHLWYLTPFFFSTLYHTYKSQP